MNLSVIMNAERCDILKSFSYKEKPYLEWLDGLDEDEMNFRKYAAMRRIKKPSRSINMIILANYLIDYPHKHRGRIYGLTKKAIKWHEDEEQARLVKDFKRVGFNTNLPQPKFEFSIPGIRPLGTVKELWEEGEKMHHCIRSYLENVMGGYVFIYHVEHSGEDATLAVNSFLTNSFDVIGPYNTSNKASDYAEKKMK